MFCYSVAKAIYLLVFDNKSRKFMYRIQANASGSKHIALSDGHLETIRDYNLFQFLAGSCGIIDEAVLDKLKLNLRSLIVSENVDAKPLLDLCIDVVYNQHMKAYGLRKLLELYGQWLPEHPAVAE